MFEETVLSNINESIYYNKIPGSIFYQKFMMDKKHYSLKITNSLKNIENQLSQDQYGVAFCNNLKGFIKSMNTL